MYRGEMLKALGELPNPMVPFFNQPLPLPEAVRILNDKTYPWLPTILFKLDGNIPPAKNALKFDLKENYNKEIEKEELIAKCNNIVREKVAFIGDLSLKVAARRY